MPQLKRERKTERVYLPSYQRENPNDPAWVMVSANSRAGDVFDSLDYEKESEKNAAAFASMIVEWNLTDENGEVADINMETIKELAIEDMNAIAQAVNKYMPKDKQFSVNGEVPKKGAPTTPVAPVQEQPTQTVTPQNFQE